MSTKTDATTPGSGSTGTSTTAPALKMPGTPPKWFNSMMRGLLRTPGIRALLGKGFAVITVTGATTGRTYSTPVQYLRHGDDVVVLSQQHRRWWRNLAAQHNVELLLAGRTIRADATVLRGDDARPLLTECLDASPRVAKYYGIGTDAEGRVDRAGIELLLDRVVVIVATPVPAS